MARKPKYSHEKRDKVSAKLKNKKEIKQRKIDKKSAAPGELEGMTCQE